MDLSSAINAHVNWKLRLSRYLAGEGEALDPRIVGRDDQCELGKWIHGEGRSHAKRPEFAALRTEHATFHRRASEVVQAGMRGETLGAQDLLAGPYSEASRVVVLTIGRLKEALKS